VRHALVYLLPAAALPAFAQEFDTGIQPPPFPPPLPQTAAPPLVPVAQRALEPPPMRQMPLVRPARNLGGAPGDIFLRQVSLDEAARMISRITKSNIVVTSSVSSKIVSLYLNDVSVENMVKNLCRAAGIWYRYDSAAKVYVLMSDKEYRQDIAIARDEITRTYVLKHHNVVSIANAIQALFGNRVNLVVPVEESAPVGMGSTSRRQVGGASSTRSSFNESQGISSMFSAPTATPQGGGGSRGRYSSQVGRQQGEDPRSALVNLSQQALESSLATPERAESETAATDSASMDRIGTSELQSLAGQGAPIQVTWNKLHNLLMVRTGDDVAMKDIEALIHDMDRPPRQVLLEMKILEVQLGNDFRSIFDIGTSSSSLTNGAIGQHMGDTPWFKDTSANPNLPNEAIGRHYYPKNAGLLGNFAELAGATAIWQHMSNTLRIRLQMLESDNRVTVLANPMLVAANNQPARLFIGDEQVLVTGASSNSQTGALSGSTTTTITVETEQRNVGQTLIILPRINDDRSVTLTIDQDNSRVIKGGTSIPVPLSSGSEIQGGSNILEFPIDTVNTANLQVTAHAQDGLTVAVGGMIRQQTNNAEERVPVLGSIPILGLLFRKTVKENSRSQIVLLITPHVLETPEEADRLAQQKEQEAHMLKDAKQPPKSALDEEPPQHNVPPLIEELIKVP
jgi:general secretion pathway protein D